ncbi:helix-turn-helix domain-containing protein [Roseibium salinum]|nr:helix-turn-helix domain-containing protein [Roseibium salinum]
MSLPLERPAPFIALLEGLAGERQNTPPGSELAQVHYVGLLLLQVWRVLRLDLIAHGRAPQGLAERFIALAGQHVREHWSVGRYAGALRVTRDRLGSAVRRATGLSPQAYLHQGLIREACELLANTGMPVAQVAFRLGFSDAAYFNRFFFGQDRTLAGPLPPPGPRTPAERRYILCGLALRFGTLLRAGAKLWAGHRLGWTSA